MFAGASFTVTAMLFLSPAARALVVPPQSPHLRWRAERSWYGSEPKHGNTLVAGSPPAVLTEERLRATRQELDRYVLKFGNAHFLSEQVKVLIAARDFFARNPTRMCEMFHFHGSDKSFAWHNYGYVYNHVLGARRRRVRNILEVGIGTNMLDMPSTMGVTGIPGASLRAWREIFPAATVVGADVDKRILFQDDGIETYYVDQTDSETVAALFARRAAL